MSGLWFDLIDVDVVFVLVGYVVSGGVRSGW